MIVQKFYNQSKKLIKKRLRSKLGNQYKSSKFRLSKKKKLNFIKSLKGGSGGSNNNKSNNNETSAAAGPATDVPSVAAGPAISILNSSDNSSLDPKVIQDLLCSRITDEWNKLIKPYGVSLNYTSCESKKKADYYRDNIRLIENNGSELTDIIERFIINIKTLNKSIVLIDGANFFNISTKGKDNIKIIIEEILNLLKDEFNIGQIHIIISGKILFEKKKLIERLKNLKKKNIYFHLIPNKIPSTINDSVVSSNDSVVSSNDSKVSSNDREILSNELDDLMLITFKKIVEKNKGYHNICNYNLKTKIHSKLKNGPKSLNTGLGYPIIDCDFQNNNNIIIISRDYFVWLNNKNAKERKREIKKQKKTNTQGIIAALGEAGPAESVKNLRNILTRKRKSGEAGPAGPAGPSGLAGLAGPAGVTKKATQKKIEEAQRKVAASKRGRQQLEAEPAVEVKKRNILTRKRKSGEAGPVSFEETPGAAGVVGPVSVEETAGAAGSARPAGTDPLITKLILENIEKGMKSTTHEKLYEQIVSHSNEKSMQETEEKIFDTLKNLVKKNSILSKKKKSIIQEIRISLIKKIKKNRKRNGNNTNPIPKRAKTNE
jgi:hypothetical protein